MFPKPDNCPDYDFYRKPIEIIGTKSVMRLDENHTVPFPWHGVGYSPVPNSDDLAMPPFGDYFQSSHHALWEDRDLDLMINMNVSVVRIWSWNFISQHRRFLDALWYLNCKPLRLLLPFLMTTKMYEDLRYPEIRMQALTDYGAFLDRYADHPSILAYLIGNEVNLEFNEQLDYMFSLVKDMIEVRNSRGIKVPITVPLAGDPTWEILLDTHYDTVDLDFWSVQVYDPERMVECINYYRNRTAHNPKPLMITEFGADAFGSLPFPDLLNTPAVNESLQVLRLNDMWKIITDYSETTMGGVVMEYHDEWWKGNFPFTSNPEESCPNLRYNKHNYCGNIVGNNTLLHEEWLGIFEQEESKYFMSNYKHCIKPRQAFYTVKGWYSLSNATEDLGAGPFCAEVGLSGAMFYLAISLVYLIFLGAIVEICFYCCNKKGKPAKAKTIIEQIEKQKSEEDIAHFPKDAIHPKRISRLLGEFIKGRVYKYTDSLDAFEIVQKRVKALIWDKIASSKEFVYSKVTREVDNGVVNNEDEEEREPELDEDTSFQVHQIDELKELEKKIFIRAVDEVYFKYMEAYRLWKKFVLGKNPKSDVAKDSSDKCRKRLDDIILWNVVHQTAGTISHAPEKVCQVFYFVKKYLKMKSKDHAPLSDQYVEMMNSKAARADLDIHGQALVDSLIKIFKRYYDDVFSKHVNYDDLNSDGQSQIIKKVDWTSVGTAASLEEAFITQIHAAKWKEEKENEEKKLKEDEEKKKNEEENKGKDPAVDGADVEGDEQKEKEEAKEAAKKKFKMRRQQTLLESKDVPMVKIEHVANSIRIITSSSTTNIDLADVPLPTINKIEDEHTTVKKYFPNLGGVLGCLTCFSWLLRLNVWMIIASQYCAEADEDDFFSADGKCRTDGMPILALADAGLACVANVCRFFVAGTNNFIILDYVKLVYFTAWFFVTIAYQMLPMIADMGIPFCELYLVLVVVLSLVQEYWLNWCQSAMPIPGRIDENRLKAYVTCGFWTGNLIIGLVYGLYKMGMLPPFLASDVVFFTSIFGVNVPLFLVVCGFLAPAVGYGIATGAGVLRVNSMAKGDLIKRDWLRKQVTSEVRYLFRLLVFWISVFAIQWVFLEHVLIPSVEDVTSEVCNCESERLQTTPALADYCTFTRKAMCWGGLSMMWLSTIMISYVSIFSAFNVVLLVAGTYSAVNSRVGNVKTWSEVEQYFNNIMSKNMVALSLVFKKKFFQYNFWNDFIDSMYSEHLLSKTERDMLKYSKNGRKRPNFRPAPYSKEAQRRVIKFLWSLEAMLNNKSRVVPGFRQRYMVRTMPSWTIMVPTHSETTVYLQEELCRPQKGIPRISTIEYLASIYPDEWHNLSRDIRSDAAHANELLDDFLNTPILKPDEGLDPRKGQCTAAEVDHICFWASYRGQTLVRTIKGLFNYRIALEKLAMAEEGVWFMSDATERAGKIKEIQKMARKKFQIIIAYQIYQPTVGGPMWTKEREAAFKKLLTRFHDFDMVYNGGDDRTSHMLRFMKNGDTKPFHIQRPGPLLIGEPKAENQHHALAFALGSVIQVNDMNMYTSLENGYKMPFMLNQFFNTPDEWEDPAMLIPTFRIVGYPEHTYTKKLSTVGDLMGSAEFCFVTIMQRVLGFLRVRAHYGHPDFLDGYWVRTRGGVSKASHLVNTNEDVFSGYEIIGRGERIKYIEYIEQEKGRESSFDNAFIFEAKLAKGAAQQIKSPHVYLLNERLPLLVRLSLFFGSIGFYVSTMLMSMTIDFYIFSILLYISSGVDYHKLGLLDAVIAVPWILQIGYIQALPLLLELSIEQGIWEGLALFLKRLLIGIVFFVFHVRTKSYYFAQGLLSGKGGYMGTGRGFGLDRRTFLDLYKLYFDSHFNNALILFVACMAYCIASSDRSSEIALRLMSILLVVFSWMVAPILFNPYPTREGQQADFDQMLEWIRSPVDLKPEPRFVDEIAKAPSEVERKKIITRWWSGKEPSSFRAYNIKNTIEEWQTEDHLFKGVVEKGMLFLQKFVFLMWRFLPWILLCLPTYHYESFYYLFFVIVCVGLAHYIDRRHGERHEYFNTIRVAMLLILAPLVTVLVNAQITFKELIVSMLLYLVVFYASVADVALGFINNVLIKKMKSLEGADLFVKRVKIPQFFYSMNSFWPAITLMFLALINTFCVMFNSFLTTLLYNGAVNDKWMRAYLQIKMQFVDKSIILQAVKDQSRDSGIHPLSSSESGSADPDTLSNRDRTFSDADYGENIRDRIEIEMDGVRSEVVDHVDLLDQKISAMRDLMTKNMETLRKQIMSLPAGSGGPLNFAGMDFGLSYEEIKRQIEEKTKIMLDPNLPEKDRDAANIELEKLFVLLESTPEYRAEEAEKAEEKKRINEPIDRKALEEMRAKYSEASMAANADIKNRFTVLPALKLIVSDKAEIVKKHSNDWKFLTTNELTAQEMRAIRSNLPNFGRNQLRQLAWVKSLDDRIDRVESGAEKVANIPRPSPLRPSGDKLPPPPPPAALKSSLMKSQLIGSRKSNANATDLFDEIKNKAKLKKVSFDET